MPRLKKIGPFRFFFYSNEGDEPPHIHVRRERSLAKFWLDPLALAHSTRFAAHELRKVFGIIEEDREIFLEAWHEHQRRRGKPEG